MWTCVSLCVHKCVCVCTCVFVSRNDLMCICVYTHISFKIGLLGLGKGIYHFSWDKLGILSAKAFTKMCFMSTAQTGTVSCSSLLEVKQKQDLLHT